MEFRIGENFNFDKIAPLQTNPILHFLIRLSISFSFAEISKTDESFALTRISTATPAFGDFFGQPVCDFSGIGKVLFKTIK